LRCAALRICTSYARSDAQSDKTWFKACFASRWCLPGVQLNRLPNQRHQHDGAAALACSTTQPSYDLLRSVTRENGAPRNAKRSALMPPQHAPTVAAGAPPRATP
jgi:hypothetical protein